MLRVILWLTVVVGVTLTHSARSETFTSTDSCDLAKLSNSEAVDQPCFQYVKGFLEGAVVTDAATLEGIKAERGFTSNFSKRAFSHRVGGEHEGVPATYFAQFCLPGDRVTDDTVMQILKLLPTKASSRDPLKEQVYDIIREEFPCRG
ncbi:hypothetical protein [Paraferrimonas sedimenticola]|uniref:Rap1a immunity protein domain-containing protein n=1 Tax=Paraferrimonas sedimenticola TaxID=375674 RepID=A0AA37RX22_9GAMM|nr:hypothetical protein [Paraferrimonas sedimenticola]GLP96287.1 hypothetical protein GCM10007895_15930 [Paraferrimonas sedimenticola]